MDSYVTVTCGGRQMNGRAHVSRPKPCDGQPDVYKPRISLACICIHAPLVERLMMKKPTRFALKDNNNQNLAIGW